MALFRAGDLITCVDNTGVSAHLTAGRIYRVSVDSTDEDLTLLDYDDKDHEPVPYATQRFLLAVAAPTSPRQQATFKAALKDAQEALGRLEALIG